MTAELLIKVRNAPGLCSKEEIQQVMDFYQDLWEKVSLFKEGVGYDPVGLTLPSFMDSLKYYLER